MRKAPLVVGILTILIIIALIIVTISYKMGSASSVVGDEDSVFTKIGEKVSYVALYLGSAALYLSIKYWYVWLIVLAIIAFLILALSPHHFHHHTKRKHKERINKKQRARYRKLHPKVVKPRKKVKKEVSKKNKKATKKKGSKKVETAKKKAPKKVNEVTKSFTKGKSTRRKKVRHLKKDISDVSLSEIMEIHKTRVKEINELVRK